MKIMLIVGACPQFVKLAPIAKACAQASVEHLIVHTGQHNDPMMSEVFFQDLEIPRPDVHLNVGSASHGVQTGRMLAELEPVIAEAQPDWVLVYGDTNSTLAGALAAVKIHQRVAHLKAVLRSLNRDMPEEINRVLTDHAEYRELSESDLPGAKVIFDCRGILAPSRFPAARYLRAGGGASADSDLAAAFANAKLATDA